MTTSMALGTTRAVRALVMMVTSRTAAGARPVRLEGAVGKQWIDWAEADADKKSARLSRTDDALLGDPKDAGIKAQVALKNVQTALGGRAERGQRGTGRVENGSCVTRAKAGGTGGARAPGALSSCTARSGRSRQGVSAVGACLVSSCLVTSEQLKSQESSRLRTVQHLGFGNLEELGPLDALGLRSSAFERQASTCWEKMDCEAPLGGPRTPSPSYAQR